MAGEQLQRVAGVLVLEHQPAELHVIARGVLHAGQDAIVAQAHQHGGVELGVDAHGQVVGEQRELGVLADDAEVALVLLGAAQGVEGSGAHEAVDVVLLGALDLLDHALGLHVDDAGQDGHAVVDDAHGLLQQLEALVVVEEGDLAAGA